MIYLSKGGVGANSDHTWIRPWSLQDKPYMQLQHILDKNKYEVVIWNSTFYFQICS